MCALKAVRFYNPMLKDSLGRNERENEFELL